MRRFRVMLSLALVAALAVLLAGCGGAPSSAFHAAGYYVRGGTVYYLESFPGDAFKIADADAKSFKILDPTYAKDKNAVYLDGSPLPEADPASFELLDEPGYSKDSGHVFLRDRVLTEDVSHFELIGGGLSKDGTHVYSAGGVISDDPQHFKVLVQADGYLYVEDSRTVSVNGNPIAGADPATFEVIAGAYAKDADHTYYFDGPVADADPASFTVLTSPYARDDGHAYWMGKVVAGADPESFVVLNAAFECTADSAHAYYQDRVITDFDPSTIPSGATVNGCTETTVSYS